MAEAPERIYLQVGPDCEAVTDEQMDSGEVTWASDRVFDTDIEYVRADRQTARIAELEESLDTMARGEAWFIDPHAHKNVMTGEYASAVKRATPNFPFDGLAWFRDRDGLKEQCWLSECYSTREAAEAARKAAQS